MRELWIVMQREFRVRVRTRSFFWGTVLTPLIFAGIFAVPTLLSGGGALLRNLDVLLQKETGVRVTLASDPLCGTVLGAGRVLEDLDKYQHVLGA